MMTSEQKSTYIDIQRMSMEHAQQPQMSQIMQNSYATQQNEVHYIPAPQKVMEPVPQVVKRVKFI